MNENEEKLQENNSEPKTSEATWWIDEGIPGIGNKPSWLGDKFKSAADLAKSYQELEKRVGVAPDNYDFSKSKYLDPDYAPFKELQDLAKSKRVPMDVMDKMLDSVDKYMSEFSTDITEERQKLGDNAKEKLDTLNNWAKANLSEQSFTALTSQLNTADAVLALDELRNKMMSNTNNVPSGNEHTNNETISLADIQAELNENLDKYKSNPKYRKELQQKMELAAKQSEYVDKKW